MQETRFRMKSAALAVATLALGAVMAIASPRVSHALLVTSQTDVVDPPGSERFGESVIVLVNGNYVVSDPLFDLGGVQDVGVIYLYDGTTNALISTLTGSSAFDRIGSTIATLGGFSNARRKPGTPAAVSLADPNGPTASNFLIMSPSWDNGTAVDAGALTWVSGTVGLNGTVGATNSLVGSLSNDAVGLEYRILANGNYLSVASNWDSTSPPAVNAGAVTWGNGATGTTGIVSSLNSLVGSSTGDSLGQRGGVTALKNGNYVVASSVWDSVSPALVDAGAATWGNGIVGTVGQVSSANSLVGASAGDAVGSSGVVGLSNGNYVVNSDSWTNAATSTIGAGAATWGNGTTGTTGQVSAANSLVGSFPNSRVGNFSTALTNGNYVVSTFVWGDGTTPRMGAATWRDGSGPSAGMVSAANSLVGSSAGDSVGSGVTALNNGNYVVQSTSWHNGAVSNAGAATWGDGQIGTIGVVSIANSLVGSTANDGVGNVITQLTNGNYVVGSPYWDDNSSGTTDVGAITWGDGATGTAGIVSISNSLIGSTANDSIGAYNVAPLKNGNYVVASWKWDNGPIVDAGAVTWGSGATGIIGLVTTSNSLVGAVANEKVGESLPVALANGSYLVATPLWDNGVASDAGAVTWGSGSSGVAGIISATNSLVGTSSSDRVGSTVTPLANGNYAVTSSEWDKGTIPDVGAVTFGDGTAGIVGTVSTQNSLVGSSASDRIGSGGVSGASDGSYFVVSPLWDNGSIVDAGAVTYRPSTEGVLTITATNSAIGTPPGSIMSVDTHRTASGSIAVTTSQNRFILFNIPSDYIVVPPARIADTRPRGETTDALFAMGGIRPQGSTLQLTVAGRGGVPADARAVALNVTATGSRAAGYATVYPCGSPQPNASNLNFATDVDVANDVIAKIGADGRVCIYVSAPTEIVVDVSGFFPSSTAMVSTNPARLLDTRPAGVTIDGLQQANGKRIGGSVTKLPVAGRGGLAADVGAVVLNVTTSDAANSGYATVYACDGPIPVASNLNYRSGTDMASLVIAKPDKTEAICVFTSADTHLIVDVAGYFPPGTTYKPRTPARLLETRFGASTVDGGSLGAGLRPAGTVTEVVIAGRGGVPKSAASVALNVTAVDATADGYVTVYPCGLAVPVTSTLNYQRDQAIANSALVEAGVDGKVCVYNSQPTHLIVDVEGYFTG
jgi:trimeric autotransporter adhesin